MVKTTKPCYQSSTGAGRPNCQLVSGLGLCPSCLDALALNEEVKAAKAILRIRKNRDSARRSKQRKEERMSDLYSDNIALTCEREDLAIELEDLNRANDALAVAIKAKTEQRDAIIAARKLRSRQHHPPTDA